MLRMMVVTAHPDDEVANFGGALLVYANRGVETSVVCLTPGQAASHRGGAKDDRELAEMRRKEFAAACKILKVSHGVVLDYPDGQLHRQDAHKVVANLTQRIREFRPHVLLTFGPDGGLSSHTDHAMASVFATMAFHWAGRANRFAGQLTNGLQPHHAQKLYHATADFQLAGRDPATMSPVTTVMDISQCFETKMEAFRAHTSQAHLQKVFEENVRPRPKVEMYHLAACVKQGPISQESDLFAGISPSEP
jgi:LmbE family N-acetylglucosaminyl deacetylase